PSGAPEPPGAPAPGSPGGEARARRASGPFPGRAPGAPRPAGEEHDTPAGASAREAEAEAEAVARLLALPGSASTSIGGPRDGRLEGGVALPAAGPGFRGNPRRPNPSARFGTVELVQALVGAAAVVGDALPGSTLVVNDLGFREGGPIPHHGSHRAGRDVDVLFYLVDAEGRPVDSVGAFLAPRGRGVDFRDLAVRDDDVDVVLDAERTWRFVQALIEGPSGPHLPRVFVAEHLRALLLEAAERADAPAAARERFGAITCQPGYPHDDHLHLRFYCTPEDLGRGCEDSGPTYRWRRDELAALGLEPVINRPRPDRPRSARTSPEEARAAAGPMHRRVEAWLARRQAWMSRPHPGRLFCR
ncbi:MAG: penicillin-insensitive murein endopeptidase, partial [Sandaracinaceae bacterium]